MNERLSNEDYLDSEQQSFEQENDLKMLLLEGRLSNQEDENENLKFISAKLRDNFDFEKELANATGSRHQTLVTKHQSLR